MLQLRGATKSETKLDATSSGYELIFNTSTSLARLVSARQVVNVPQGTVSSLPLDVLKNLLIARLTVFLRWVLNKNLQLSRCETIIDKRKRLVKQKL